MKKLLSLLTLLCLEKALHAQYIYTIKADSVKITNSCDTAELIIENHTQNVPGFLFNKGRGRTEFRKVLQKVSDTLYMVGPDSIKLANAWLQGGNAWGTTGILGTKDYNHIDFYTTNTLRGRWTNTGNLIVGSSTDNIYYKLQVNGNVYANGNKHLIGNLAIMSGNDVGISGVATGIRIDNIDYSPFIFEGTSQGWAKDMFVFTDASNVGQDVYAPDQSIIRIKSGFKVNNIAGNTANVLNINPNYNLNLATSNPLVMRGIFYNPILTSIVPGSKHIAIETVTGDVLLGTTSGNVGVGTSTPGAQLHTTGAVRFAGLTSNESLTRVVVCDANGNLYYRNNASWSANDVINSDLAVNDTLSAQKMKITQTGPWPDYVFSNQYHLPSLNEVERFIKLNNHLPGIPSAIEVEKKGIDVGENQAALLKKIEELTLYTIEQDKELKSLKQEMAELKALIKEKN